MSRRQVSTPLRTMAAPPTTPSNSLTTTSAPLAPARTLSPTAVRAWWLAETDYREAEWRVEG